MRGGVFFLCVGLCFNVEAQFKNIQLAEQTNGETLTPSITINQKNTAHIIVGVAANRLVSTMDAGATWKDTNLTLTQTPGIKNYFLSSDAKGDAYFFYQTIPTSKGASHIGFQKSEDAGNSWTENERLISTSAKEQYYPYLSFSPRKQYTYATWTEFDRYGLKDSACQSQLFFSISSNSGKKWSTPVQISQDPGDCLDEDNVPAGAIPAASMDGKLFIAWGNRGTIYFDRSYDGGDTWLRNDLALAKQVNGSSLTISGVGETKEYPVLAIDNSTSRYHGSLYIVWADQRNGKGDTDIWLIRSSNRGDNWTAPERINHDEPGKQQFMPWISVDQSTGIIYIAYYDRRDHSDEQTEVYLAWSSDGGSSFKEQKISESSFVPEAGKSLGDRISIAAHKGVITPVWVRIADGKASVWTALIKESDLLKAK